MDVITVLQYYAPIALTVFVVGVALKLGRWATAAVAGGTFSGRSENELHPPEPEGRLEALRKVVAGPVEHFYSRANRLWTAGYILYHIGIISILAGYVISGVIVLITILQGNPIPNVATGAVESYNYSLVNVLALVFGNAEAPTRTFLFGGLATEFVAVTWVLVAAAFVGNLSLLITILRKKSGAVLSDIDSATAGMRTSGDFSWEHLVVTVLVFGIIMTEILARLQIVHHMVYFHVALGMTIFLVTPFTYLIHLLYFPITLYYATKRRMNRTVA